MGGIIPYIMENKKMLETTNQQKNNQNQNLTVSCLKCGPNSSRVDCL
jgi:hypothetical protein